MTPWLHAVESALDAAARAVPVFFRDDDAGWSTPSLVALLDVFEPFDVPGGPSLAGIKDPEGNPLMLVQQ